MPFDGWLSFSKRGQRSLESTGRAQKETDEHRAGWLSAYILKW